MPSKISSTNQYLPKKTSAMMSNKKIKNNGFARMIMMQTWPNVRIARD